MKRVIFFVLLGAVIASFGIWGAGAGASSNRSHQPKTKGLVVLPGEEQHPAVGLTLDPPPNGLEVPITEQQAFDIAWKENQPDSQPSSQEADLALLTKAGYDKAPVWVVRYSGVCVAVSGPFDPKASPGEAHEPHCGSEWDVLVNAVSGDFVLGFSDHDSDHRGRTREERRTPESELGHGHPC